MSRIKFCVASARPSLFSAGHSELGRSSVSQPEQGHRAVEGNKQDEELIELIVADGLDGAAPEVRAPPACGPLPGEVKRSTCDRTCYRRAWVVTLSVAGVPARMKNLTAAVPDGQSGEPGFWPGLYPKPLG